MSCLDEEREREREDAAMGLGDEKEERIYARCSIPKAEIASFRQHASDVTLYTVHCNNHNNKRTTSYPRKVEPRYYSLTSPTNILH
jgi:hypothetical protein